MSETVRVQIGEDERWPTYYLKAEGEVGFRAKPYGEGDSSRWVDVDTETLARWREIEAAYDAMQDELSDLRG